MSAPRVGSRQTREHFRKLHEGAPAEHVQHVHWPARTPRYVVDLGPLHAVEYWKRTPSGEHRYRHEFGENAAPDLVHDDRGRLYTLGGRYTVTTHGIEDRETMRKNPHRRHHRSRHHGRRRHHGRTVRYNPTGGQLVTVIGHTLADGVLIGATILATTIAAAPLLERTRWSPLQRAGAIIGGSVLLGLLTAKHFPRVATGFFSLAIAAAGLAIAGAIRIASWSRQLVGATTGAGAGGGTSTGAGTGTGTGGGTGGGTSPPGADTRPTSGLPAPGAYSGYSNPMLERVAA